MHTTRVRSCRGAALAVAAIALASGGSHAGGLALVETVVADNGDGDGFADTRETVELRLRMRNTSGAALQDVRLFLATDTPDRVCITTPLVDLGDLAIGETKLAPPFVLHVLDVDRTALGLDGHAAYAARFRILAEAGGSDFPHLLTPALELDVDLDVSGGAGPTTFVESFESVTLGAFVVENLDQGRHGSIASDGYRCQYNDPDWVDPPSNNCYLGATAAAANGVFWGLSGSSVSPLDGRAFTGEYSLYFGVDLGPPKNWTTPTATLEAVRSAQPIALGHSGSPSVLSIKHQASFADSRCFGNIPAGRSFDRGVVQAQLADGAGAPAGPWVKLYPFQNGYDQTHVSNFVNCGFDPTDDGNTEDDFFEPDFPARRFGPSSTCAPGESFTNIGETSLLFDPDNVGRADGPGLAGFWGIGTWIESKFDLSRFRGRKVRLRFLASTQKFVDGFVTWDDLGVTNPNGCDDGWWIDDVTVTGALATPATVAADIHDNSGLPGAPPGDGDGDAVRDACDNCTSAGNAAQLDQDLDGLGDACDPCITDHALVANTDADGDGRCTSDNCPTTYNPDQIDGDRDDSGEACDCDDGDADTYPGAAERNDGADNQCPGDLGYGAIDEVTGPIGFYDPTNQDVLSWPSQIGAVQYAVARAAKADFTTGCVAQTLAVGALTYSTAGLLPAGQIRYYLVRAIAPHAGSWGQDSSGAERIIPCAP
jgi:hypothetical protein